MHGTTTDGRTVNDGTRQCALYVRHVVGFTVACLDLSDEIRAVQLFVVLTGLLQCRRHACVSLCYTSILTRQKFRRLPEKLDKESKASVSILHTPRTPVQALNFSSPFC